MKLGELREHLFERLRQWSRFVQGIETIRVLQYGSSTSIFEQ
jgi:hypothetical protein